MVFVFAFKNVQIKVALDFILKKIGMQNGLADSFIGLLAHGPKSKALRPHLRAKKFKPQIQKVIFNAFYVCVLSSV